MLRIMSICFPKHTNEGKALIEAVGEFEATRDWMENNYQVRTPEEVLEKLGMTNQINYALMTPEEQAFLAERSHMTPEEQEAMGLEHDEQEMDQIIQDRKNPNATKITDLASLKKAVGLSKLEVDGRRRGYINSLVKKYNNKTGSTYKIKWTQVGESTEWRATITGNEGPGKQLAMFYKEDGTPETDPAEIQARNDVQDSPQARDPLLAAAGTKLDPLSTDISRASEIISKLSDLLASRYSISYQMISPAEANERFGKDNVDGPVNPWAGEPAFFYKGTVYFVGDHLTTNIVFHEFSHPIVRAILKTNPELFYSLFKTLETTSEGQEIITKVAEQYKNDYTPDTDYFKEECIVSALSGRADGIRNSIEQSTGFKGLVSKIMYHIKQFFRKLFGKNQIDISKLDVSTSLDDLAKMLANDEFQIDTELINQDDIAAYTKFYEEFEKDLKDLDKKIDPLVNSMLNYSRKRVANYLPEEEYAKIRKSLENDYGKHQLGDIIQKLSAVSGPRGEELRTKISEQDYLDKQGAALIGSLHKLEYVASKMKADVKELGAKENISKPDMLRLQYIKDLMNNWKGFLESTNGGLSNLDNKSPLRQLINLAKQHISDMESAYQPVMTKGWKVMMSEILKPMQENIENGRQAELDNAKARGASAKLLKFIEQDWEKRRITPEKLEAMLKGTSKDANYFNNMIEGWMYSSDLVVGGLHRYIRDHISDSQSRAIEGYNKFLGDVLPLIKEAGYNPKDMKAFADLLVFADKVGQTDQDGNFKETTVLRFINQHKDWNLADDKFKFDLRALQEKAEQSGDWKQFLASNKEYSLFKTNFMYRPFVPEYYDRDKIFDESLVGEKARILKNNIFERMNTLQENIPSGDELAWMNYADELDSLWEEYRQLHAIVDLNGKDKTGEDLEIANLLNKYRDISRSFHEWKEIPGLFQDKYQQLQKQLIDKGLEPGSPEFQQAEDEWVDKNTSYRVKPEFYTRTQSIYDKIKAIYDSDPSPSPTEIALAGLFKDRRDILSEYRDKDGQPNGLEMPEDILEKVKKLEQEIIKQQAKLNIGLTPDEQHDLNYYFSVINHLNPTEKERFDELVARSGKHDMDEGKKAALAGLWATLSNIQSKIPTDYYIDIFNNYLSKANTDGLKDENNKGYMERETGNYIINLPSLKAILEADPEFKKWFKANHIQRAYWDYDDKVERKRWERTSAWSVVRPNDPDMIEHTSALGLDGKTRQIEGAPTTRFMKFSVKKEFHTPKVTGKTVDIHGRWLPRSVAEGALDDRFINQEYDRIKQQDPKRFALLEKIKEHYLKMQENTDNYAQLYYDLPRFQKHGVEAWQTPGYVGNKANSVSEFARNTWDSLTQAKDDPNSAYQYDNEIKAAAIDIVSHDPRIPVEGLTRMNPQDVSVDIFRSTARYYMSLERQRELTTIHPFARSLQNVLNDTDDYTHSLSRVNKMNMINQNIFSGGKTGKKVRAASVNSMIARDIYGEYRTGLFADGKGVNKAMNLAFKGASLSYLGLNLPTAMTINLTQQLNNFIEASAGKYFNLSSMAWGTAQSYRDMADVSMEINKLGIPSLNIQLLDAFNVIQGRTHEKLGKNLSRTFLRDTISLSWFYSPLKWLEAQASCQQFEAMMKFKKIKTLDGKEISYRDAFELQDGKLAVKANVDKTYGLTGEEFKKFHSMLDKVQRDLIGSFDQAGQPELQRYAIFRMFSFLRKHITNMIANRWAFTRPDPGIQDLKTGYYWKSLQTFRKATIEGWRYFGMMTPDEQQAFRKVATEVSFLIASALAMGLLWGWGADDKDRYEKLRARSGPLPALGVADSQYPFQLDGWLANHALLQLMKVRSWDQMWLPIPGLGLKDYLSLTNMVPIATGPTVQKYGTIIDDLIKLGKGDPTEYYQRPVGPFIWQQEGSAKILNHLAGIPGATGNTVQPDLGIQKQQMRELVPQTR